MTQLQANPIPDAEPFGQAGVMRYVRAVGARILLIFTIVAIIMGVRSYRTWDVFVIEGRLGKLQAGSIEGRVVMFYDPRPLPYSDLRFESMPAGRLINDAWRDGISKTIGLGIGHGTPHGTLEQAWWFRGKWPTLAVITGAGAVWYAVHRRRKLRLEQP